jgi:hypothetical protein
MTFSCHLFFRGTIQRLAFEAALVEALARHPLLQAIIRPAKANKPCWVSAGEQTPPVHWGRSGEGFEFETAENIDLTHQVGLRMWVRTGSGKSEILLQFHHACCDGTGAYRFIGDLLAEYGLRTAGELDAPVVEVCDPRLLKERRGKMAGEAAYGTRLGVIKQGLGHAVEVFSRRITPLAVPRRIHSEPDYPNDFQIPAYPGIESYIFDRLQYKALREAASCAGAMFNDLLLSEMFITMRQWNQRHGKNGRHWLRIMMPTDLREKEDILMPAANMTAYSFITRSTKQCYDPQALLRGVRDETLRIKREKSGKRFIDAVMASHSIPGLLEFLLRRNRCLATVVLSNVGDPSRRFLARFPREGGKVRCGNLRLEHVAGVPPLRQLCRATVSVVTYGRELAVHVRCDPHHLTREDAREFLKLFVSRLSTYLPAGVPAAAEPETVAIV